MNNDDIRNTFFNYFLKHHHHKVLSAPLVPAKDPTLMFTNAGMNQFKGVFTQQETREYKRAVSIQKCMRVAGKQNDFDEVGRSNFHHTFFEMLGNFSFGDYFKEKACLFGWELLTQHYGFKPEQLWVTVFREDDEAADIWRNKIGVPADRIVRMDEKDNFWQMGDTGPCGPCSEIHFDLGDTHGPAEFIDGNKRFIEIWNLVFMQYDRDEKGNLNPLPAPSIDTGMGLERLTSLLQGVSSNYHTDLFRPIIEHTALLADVDVNDAKNQTALNVVADHSRALTFLIAEGILPSNEGRGYILRRILRRAAKHGKSLGFTSAFLHQVSGKVTDVMKAYYPELEYSRQFVAEAILAEEEQFERTLTNSLKRFDDLLAQALESDDKIISGDQLFKLSDTYGFPLDFARDLAMEKDVAVDVKGYAEALTEQRERSRSHQLKRQKTFKSLKNVENFSTEFSGYTTLEEEATLLAIYVADQPVQHLEEGQEGILIFNRTPFYAESGGQVGDRGSGKNNNAYFQVVSTRTAPAGAFLHSVQLKKGSLTPGDNVDLKVDAEKRKDTEVHHSATHLLHAALREVLGLHVKQAGSYVGPDKLRFDFTHGKALSPAEVVAVETLVNQKVRENLPVVTDVLPYEDAVARGAMAIFEEKYSDVVRMLSMGDFSKELCGGTHLAATGEIGYFKITANSPLSSGVRRIEAIAGKPGFAVVNADLDRFGRIYAHFSRNRDNIEDFLINMELEFKDKEKHWKKMAKQKAPKMDVAGLIGGGKEIRGVHVVVEFLEGADRKELSTLADEIKEKTGGIAVLLTNSDDKSVIIVSVAEGLTPRVNAGKIIKDLSAKLNGRGGGRPDFAQAGGDPVETDTFLNLQNSFADIVGGHI